MDSTHGAVEKPKALKQVPPPSFRNKVARGVWGVVWLLLYRPSLRNMHGWRRFILRAFGARIAPGAKPYPSARIWAPWNLEMGAESTLGDYVDCYSVARVVLGPKATVSQRAYICTAQRDIDAIGMPLVTGDIVINELAWIAAEAFVAPGVEVGTGGVVAARGVATKRVPDWTVVGGNPARPIRDRRRQQTI